MTGGAPPGGERVRAEVLSRGPAGIMQAILDRDPAGIREGDPLPLGWHWFYFKQPLRASSLGVDGHEHRGAFMPDMDLPRRMWAGGTLRLLGPLRIGEWAELRSRVAGVEEKRGKSGRLVFVTVGQTVLRDVSAHHGHAFPVFRTYSQCPPHPLRPPLCHGSGRLSRPPGARPADGAAASGRGHAARHRAGDPVSLPGAGAALCGPADHAGGKGGVERPGQRKTRIPRIGARRARGRGPWT